ncbi:MAG: hypothetical protein HC905_08905 [Bacteroidales bacterium]|nr:hypothetical protein [Bacteroidales bacterium]
MKSFFRSFLIVILLLQSQRTFNQEYVTGIDVFSVVEGLSQTTINTIFQDSRGYLWIGTQGGLNRYDGYTFKAYNPQLVNKNSISSNFITCITEDKKGIFGLEHEMALIYIVTKRITFNDITTTQVTL